MPAKTMAEQLDLEKKIALSLSMAEAAVQDMAEAGLTPLQIAIGMSWHVMQQAKLAMPDEITYRFFLQSLIKD